MPTPSPRGIRKTARDNRRKRRSSVTSDCEVVSEQRVGHEFESPIDLSQAVEIVESDRSAGRNASVDSWLQDVDVKPSPSFFQDDDNEIVIKRSDSLAIDFGELPLLSRSTRAAGRARREPSMDSDLEVMSARPVKRSGGFIDLSGSDTPIDLTGDPE